MIIGKLTSLGVAGDSLLLLTWDDGWKGQINLSQIIAHHAGLSALKDPTMFMDARLSEDGWSVVWPNGADFGAQQLRRWADEQAGNNMSPDAFRAWIDGHLFTLENAAAALGLSRRTIAYYLSGEHVVPKTVMLACAGYDRRDAA
jgi:hypothetical protein